MSDPIYGDRRCPTCQSVRARQEDPCWYCARKMPTEDDVATAMAATICKEVDGNILNEVLRAVGVPVPIVADPAMPEGTFELVQVPQKPLENLAATQKLFSGPVSGRMASREQMEAVMLNVRAMQSHHIHDDAVQLARWLKDALAEIDELRASNDRLVSRIDELHQTDPGC